MKDKISRDIKTAMKEKAVLRLSTLRLVLAEFQKKEKEKGVTLTAESAVQILQSMVRKRKESIEQYRKAEREELAQKEEQEIVILQEYLPEQLSEDEIRTQVLQVISELGADGPSAMGKVMGILVKKLSGTADGGTISRIVKEELQKLSS